MKLFLASEAKNPTSFKKLEEYVNGFKGKSIAYVPTAANGEGWGSWKEGGSWKLVNTLEADVTLVQLEDYRTPEVVKLIKGKDFLWVAGGAQGYLTYWIRRTELDKQLKEILDQGTIYIGSSAGSMVLGQSSELSEWYIGEPEPCAHYLPPLGLVDFDIYPHYQNELYDEIKRKYNGNKLYLLKNGEAIVVEDTSIKVLGEERIIQA